MSAEAEELREEQARQEEMQFHQQAQASAMQQAEEIYDNFVRELLDSPLSEGSKNLLRNLISKDFVLANLNKEEVHELKWRLRIKREKFYAMHPSRECLVTGEDREYINDDRNDSLLPLTQEQKIVADDFFDGIWVRITRAKGMKQQEIMKTSIHESHVQRDQQEQQSGGLLGRLGSS